MKRATIITIAVLILLLIVGSFAFASLSNVGYAKAKATANINKIDPDLQDKLDQNRIQKAFSEKEITVLIETKDIDQFTNENPDVEIINEYEDIDVIEVEIERDKAYELSESNSVEFLFDDTEAEINYLDARTDNLRFHQSSLIAKKGGEGIKVCVLDTGIDASHKWFKGVPIAAQKDFVNNDNIANDDNGHGTHVSGIIVSGAPGVTLLEGKVCTGQGSCPLSAILEGMQWCADQGADVVSMSLGAKFYDLPCDVYPQSQLVNQLTTEHDMLFSMASGNKPQGSGYKVNLPGCAEKGIAVSAVEVRDSSFNTIISPASYDITNTETICDENNVCERYDSGFALVDISANGNVISAWPKNKEVQARGTSMATPAVSAAIALLKSIDGAQSEQIRQALYNGAIPGYPGVGLLDVASSCQNLMHENPVTVSCNGYYTTVPESKNPASKDWYRIELDGEEKDFQKYRTWTVSARPRTAVVDPVQSFYTKTTWKRFEIRKVSDSMYIAKNMETGVMEVHLFIQDPKKLYTGKLISLKDGKARNAKGESELRHVALEDCTNNLPSHYVCQEYLSQIDPFNEEAQNIEYNSLPVVKEWNSDATQRNTGSNNGVSVKPKIN